MNARVDHLLIEALALEPDERSVLVVALIDSLEGDSDPSIADSWRREAQKRWDDLRSGRTKAIPWAEAKARLSVL